MDHERLAREDDGPEGAGELARIDRIAQTLQVLSAPSDEAPVEEWAVNEAITYTEERIARLTTLARDGKQEEGTQGLAHGSSIEEQVRGLREMYAYIIERRRRAWDETVKRTDTHDLFERARQAEPVFAEGIAKVESQLSSDPLEALTTLQNMLRDTRNDRGAAQPTVPDPTDGAGAMDDYRRAMGTGGVDRSNEAAYILHCIEARLVEELGGSNAVSPKIQREMIELHAMFDMPRA